MVSRPRYLLGLILLLGAVLRLTLYFSRPSLSIDEAMLALDIGPRSFGALLHPLPSLQTAAPLFLWSVKLAATVAGMSEFALRAIPLAAGLVVPALVWRVGRRLLDDRTALLAAALAAVAPTLVQYSVIVKPYITDAAIALVVLDGALTTLADPASRPAWTRLALAGLLAILSSVPAPFLLAGVTVALAIRAPRARGPLAACLVLWGAGFLALYVALYRPVAASAYMQRFWGASFFAPLQWSGWRLLGRVTVQALVARPVPWGLVLPVGALAAGGFWLLARARGGAIAALLGIPVLAALGGSALQRYPLSARLLLGLVPVLVLCCAAGVAAVIRWNRGLGRGLGTAALLALATVDVTHPYRTPDLRSAIASLTGRAGAEPIYLSSGAVPAWAFYTTDWSSPDTAYLERIRTWAGRPDAPAYPNAGPRGHPVADTESDGLEARRRGRTEIVGLASGIQWREVTGLTGTVPDSGWAAHEAARAGAAAAPVVWLLIGNAYAGTAAALVASLEARGAVHDFWRESGGVRVYRFRLGN